MTPPESVTTSTDEQLLYAAILDAPAEDTPRLMYADAIEESDPARAEFVRWHVTDRFVILRDGAADRWRRNHRRAHLSARHWPALNALLSDPALPPEFIVSRGFVNSVTVRAWPGEPLDIAALLGAHPVEEIRLPFVRVEIAAPDGPSPWIMRYYDGATLLSQNHTYSGRAVMIKHVISDVEALQGELT